MITVVGEWDIEMLRFKEDNMTMFIVLVHRKGIQGHTVT